MTEVQVGERRVPLPDSGFKYDVFLSYASADRQAVDLLAQRLLELGVRPFFDATGAGAGAPWLPEIERGFASSAAMAVLIRSDLGPWQRQEAQVGIDRSTRATDDPWPVIPVLLPGADEARVPLFLRTRGWVDLRLGLDDEAALARLVAGLRGEATEQAAFALPDDPAPYRGLLAFGRDDSQFFFGREPDVARVLEKLARSPFVAVVGASGSGKSSLIGAGVIPKLVNGTLADSHSWEIPSAVVRPGARPLRALADWVAAVGGSTLSPSERLSFADDLTGRLASADDGLRTSLATLRASAGYPVLLVIDQLEELFTQCAESVEACRGHVTQFVGNLADAIRGSGGKLKCVTTLRADFLDRCLEYPALCALLEDWQVLLGDLDPDGRREAIVRPARTVGAEFEKGLVNAILRDVADGPVSLPLLQHALYELWRRRRGRWLTLDAYDAIGGVVGALRQRADQTYDSLLPSQQSIAKRIFIRLTSLGEGTSDTRRRVEREELYASSDDRVQVDAVIDTLAGPDARLIVASGQTVEVVHDSLIREWGLLRTWLDADRAAIHTHRRLTTAAGEWARASRDDSYLFQGARLAEASDWASAHAKDLTALEREFVDASVRHQDEEANRELEAARQVAEIEHARATEAVEAATRLKAERDRAEAQTRVADARRLEAEVARFDALVARNLAEALRAAAEAERASSAGGDPDFGDQVGRARALHAEAEKFRDQARIAKEGRDRVAADLERLLAAGALSDPKQLSASQLFTLEALDVGFGECFIVHYGALDRPRFIVVDGGGNGAYARSLAPRLEQLRGRWTSGEPLPIEMVVATHSDNDRVRGIYDWLHTLAATGAEGGALAQRIATLWYNSFELYDTRSDVDMPLWYKATIAREAEKLGIPLNEPFDRLVMLPPTRAARTVRDGGLSVVVLGPSAHNVRQFYEYYRQQVKRRAGDAVAFVSSRDDEPAAFERFSKPQLDLIALPEYVVPTLPRGISGHDQSVANLSSIVIMLEFAGKRMLLTGDARADDIVAGLAQAGYLPDTGRIHLDVLHVPHYGSERNVSREFFQAVTADHYLITGNDTHGNPDTEMLAMLTEARGDASYNLHFVHYKVPSTLGKRLERFFKEERRRRRKYRIVTRESGQSLRVNVLDTVTY